MQQPIQSAIVEFEKLLAEFRADVQARRAPEPPDSDNTAAQPDDMLAPLSVGFELDTVQFVLAPLPSDEDVCTLTVHFGPVQHEDPRAAIAALLQANGPINAVTGGAFVLDDANMAFLVLRVPLHAPAKPLFLHALMLARWAGEWRVAGTVTFDREGPGGVQ